VSVWASQARVLADLRGIGAAGLRGERSGLERRDVLVEHSGVAAVEFDGGSSAPWGLRVF
jgi:hypothetical protein